MTIITRATGFAAMVLATSFPLIAKAVDASKPQGVTLYVYDVGFTLANELRRVNLARGENEVVIRNLPVRLDPTTAAISLTSGGPRMELREQRFEFDLVDADDLFDRYIGKPVIVRTADGETKGTLLAVPRPASAGSAGLPIALGSAEDGSVRFCYREGVKEVVFPEAAKNAYVEPTLIWRTVAEQDGLQNVRVSYSTDGLRWSATYEVILAPGGQSAHFTARISMVNDSGGRFENARVKLISTGKGGVAPVLSFTDRRDRVEGQAPALRYAYGAQEPAPERAVAGLAPAHTYELPEGLTIDSGETRYFQFAIQEKLPVTRLYVYDGVRFDRFQRNRRNDWNYGTEYHTAVETHLEFSNTKESGLGVDLPMGYVRAFQELPDGAVDYLGEDFVRAADAGQAGHVLLGPALGLEGERERTGYAEVKPLHEYEETFEVTLSNSSDETAEIRVVEHLYRWTDYEIVKADAEYVATGPQTIEFKPTLKPGGKKVIHYTVRYRW
ncbi:MAG: hypothetical protein V1929_07630 [bacterium]